MMFGLHFSIIVFWYSVGLTFSALIGSLLVDGSAFRPEAPGVWLVSIASSFLAAVGQLAQTRSSQLLKMGTIGVLANMFIVYSILCDYFIFEEDMGWQQLTGAFLIVVVSAYAALKRDS